jgi:hypothetical protein
MANLTHCSLNLDEYMLLRLLRVAHEHGYENIEQEIFMGLMDQFDREEPEVVVLDQDPPIVLLYEVVDLTEDDAPDVVELIGK